MELKVEHGAFDDEANIDIGDAQSDEQWNGTPNQHFAEHGHPYHKKLFVVRGDITFMVGDQRYVARKGDCFQLPANTEHSATAGPEGVMVREAHYAPEI